MPNIHLREYPNKIFLLGDSRTGTTSIHALFLRLGLKSIHYYKDAANQKETQYDYKRENWLNLQRFINESGYDAFTDYPTRSFFYELMAWRPGAYFILSTRRSTEVWRESMQRTFNLSDEMLKLSTRYYETWNEEIRTNAKFFNVRFLDICIEDDNLINAKRVAEFLGFVTDEPMPHLNSSLQVPKPDTGDSGRGNVIPFRLDR